MPPQTFDLAALVSATQSDPARPRPRFAPNSPIEPITGDLVTARRQTRPRQMRDPRARALDPNPGVQRQALRELGATTQQQRMDEHAMTRGAYEVPYAPGQFAEEAGQGVLEMTGLPSIRRSARAGVNGDLQTAAVEGGVGLLGVLGMRGLGGMGGKVRVRAPRAAPELPAPQAPPELPQLAQRRVPDAGAAGGGQRFRSVEVPDHRRQAGVERQYRIPLGDGRPDVDLTVYDDGKVSWNTTGSAPPAAATAAMRGVRDALRYDAQTYRPERYYWETATNSRDKLFQALAEGGGEFGYAAQGAGEVTPSGLRVRTYQRLPDGDTPPPVGNPSRELGPGALPIRPRQPFRQAEVGGSDDLAAAAGMGRRGPEAGPPASEFDESKVFYHGTDREYSDFDAGRSRRGIRGVYLTRSQRSASGFGPIVLSAHTRGKFVPHQRFVAPPSGGGFGGNEAKAQAAGFDGVDDLLSGTRVVFDGRNIRRVPQGPPK
jgi:hypothetical protein